MNEEFLYFVWKSGQLLKSSLKLTNGNTIQIHSFGTQNFNQGPDFLSGKVEINGYVWVGHIEMHVKTSDWYKHRHHTDPNFSNVILHVVWEHDLFSFENTENVPVLEINSIISQKVIERYVELKNSIRAFSCYQMFHENYTLNLLAQLDLASIERIQEKSKTIDILIQEHQMDWDWIFYLKLSQYLVGAVNEEAIAELHSIITWPMIQKCSDELYKLEALYFTASGLINKNLESEYIMQLRIEGNHLKNLYKLKIMRSQMWKFLRMRPGQFPTIRIAQLVTLLFYLKRPFQKFMYAENLKEIYRLFEFPVSEFWQSHYHFESKATDRKHCHIGKGTIDIIIINVLCPIMYKYGEIYCEEKWKNKSLNLLEELSPEKNRIINLWKPFGIVPESAFYSQAMIQQYTKYCIPKRCLECKLGNKIIGTSLH